MSNFATLMRRGMRRYADKYMKRRDFGRCEECGARALLVRTLWKDEDGSVDLSLCNNCYNEFVQEEIE